MDPRAVGPVTTTIGGVSTTTQPLDLEPDRREPVVALFCGSRGWSNRAAIRRDLEQLPDLSVVIEGGAQGADRIARFEATQLGLHVATVPALWSLYGKAAGPRRNAAMLKLQPSIVYAYNLGTPGTDVMVKLSRLAGIEVVERRP